MGTAAIVLEILLGLAFAMAGIMKLAGAKMHLDNFNKWRLPQWFRIVTGLVELAGAAALIVGIWNPSIGAWAGIWLAVTMLGALVTHLRIRDAAAQYTAPVVLLILSVAVVLLQSDELSGLF